ncbi:MAG: PD-(D/E)XK nuclease family protein [Synechococcales bacterium]|nr:PD-(D/E)XK nuclease family protein [Synechococcales bacterium]
MVYQLSATKLQTYQRCPYAYYLRYERRVESKSGFGAAALGTALHQTLASCHQNWHYQAARPDWDWFNQSWKHCAVGLTNQQMREGREILEQYYQQFVVKEGVFRPPLAVEGKIQASLQLDNIEFQVQGRYDRIDVLPDGLELIDYKSSREIKLPTAEEIDVQIGLYYLALEQTYQQSLKYLTLLFLRSGEKVRFQASAGHKRQVKKTIAELAQQIRQNRNWQPKPGAQCSNCSYSQYCAAVTREPAEMPKAMKKLPGLQLALGLAS